VLPIATTTATGRTVLTEAWRPGQKIGKRGVNDDAEQHEAVARLHRTLGYQTPAEYEEHNKIRNVA
jgi:hypothetical protein